MDDRNETAHPNGNIFFSTQAASTPRSPRSCVWWRKSRPTPSPSSERCYREFLLGNHDPEEREYPEATDQIREVLIHKNYLSQKDIEICLAFDIASLRNHPQRENILELHNVLVAEYGPE